MTLEPISPRETVDWYLEQKANDATPTTVQSHEYRLNHFTEWCESKGIENLNNLTGRNIQRFSQWRKDDGDLNNVSLHTQLGTLRVFLKWAENIDAVTEGLHDKILMPNLGSKEDQRDKKIEPETAFEIINYLRKYKYASDYHTIFELLWHTAARIGGIHSLDLENYHPNKQYIEFHHHPESGTRLKNGNDGERPVALNDEVCTILDDYIENQRHEIDPQEAGREPLLTTENGRMCKSIIRRRVYQITQPCWYNAGCPDDINKIHCDYHVNADKAGGCPHNLNPHAIRRGSLTYHLLRDWSKEDVGERADVSPGILEKHYDRRTDKEKLDRRRQNVKNL